MRMQLFTPSMTFRRVSILGIDMNRSLSSDGFMPIAMRVPIAREALSRAASEVNGILMFPFR